MPDLFSTYATALDSPGYEHFAITPSDSVDTAVNFRMIYVGGAGALVIVSENGTAVTYSGATAGSVIPMRGRRVNATGTTATGLVGLY